MPEKDLKNSKPVYIAAVLNLLGFLETYLIGADFKNACDEEDLYLIFEYYYFNSRVRF